MSGVFELFDQFEKTPPPKRIEQPTAKAITEKKAEERMNVLKEKRKLMTDEYRALQRKCGGEYEGMNCYNTLFIGRLAYEVTERKLLREMEAFGPVKDIKLVCDKEGKSRGICFIEYENEEDMKRAYRAADGMKMDYGGEQSTRGFILYSLAEGQFAYTGHDSDFYGNLVVTNPCKCRP